MWWDVLHIVEDVQVFTTVTLTSESGENLGNEQRPMLDASGHPLFKRTYGGMIVIREGDAKADIELAMSQA